ncbi:MAG: hypothetical protein M3416_21395 [Acidobacteriota bacterium]|nr:hypothetical protein [Acidobacteriota bacterium]
MRLKDLSRRRVSILVLGFLLLGVSLASIAAWRAAAVPQETEEAKKEQKKGLQRGVGSEVKFAKSGDSPEKVRESVDSAATFISYRADLHMSSETKARLAAAEEATLKGQGRRVSVDELTDALTDVVTERLSTITDTEIEQGVSVITTPEEAQTESQANSKWTLSSKEEFVTQVKAAREWSQRGDTAVRDTVRLYMKHEVRGRVKRLSEALPDKFGEAESEGITPVQAVLVSYSVATDDPLSDSKHDLSEKMVKRRMEAKQKRGEKRESGKAYGAHGALVSAPAHLFINRKTTDQLLDRIAGGQNQ